MSPDPVQVIGFLGIWCAISALTVGGWLVAIEITRWRNRRRVARADRVLGPRLPPAVERGGGWWAPEWEASWPEK